MAAFIQERCMIRGNMKITRFLKADIDVRILYCLNFGDTSDG